MPNNKFWSWVVFFTSLSAYAPLFVGGWKHPIEINVACFGLWVILALMITWSAKAQGFAGWRMQLAFFVGNVSMVGLALVRGGYTFNLGPSETIALYGTVATISVWVITGSITKKWNPRILYLGGIGADVLSFYPQLKQYLLPHDHPTTWMILGWLMFALGALFNVLFVERTFQKLSMDMLSYGMAYDKKKDSLQILEESAFSIENFMFISITIVVMCR